MPSIFKQARWSEPLIQELSVEGRIGFLPPKPSVEVIDKLGPVEGLIPKSMIRKGPLKLPEVSEVDVVRHYIKLSQMNYGVDLGPYPLGSCTMKYNPKICEEVGFDWRIAKLHPLQDEGSVQEVLKILHLLERWLCEITGMYKATLQPAAGAHGEFTGCLMVKAYHKHRGELDRSEMLIPDSSHGTNPASASMAGFKVLRIPTEKDGCIDLEALKASISKRTAGIMLTNPNTLGLFEKDIVEVAKMVHEAGGLLYYDGANLNGIIGLARPGDMGFDLAHLNIHKTFGAPHGGGGPGSGPVCVVKELEEFLPIPTIEYDGGRYYLNYDKPLSIGRVKAFHGNITPLLKAFTYILILGPEGLREVAEQAVINTNYFISKMKDVDGYRLPYNGKPRKHEVVLSAKPLKERVGVDVMDISKKLIDKGLHAPTIYFPLIVEEALMVEFTETEAKENIDAYAEALKEIAEEAFLEPKKVKEAPLNTSVKRLDLAKANHPMTITLTYRQLLKTK